MIPAFQEYPGSPPTCKMFGKNICTFHLLFDKPLFTCAIRIFFLGGGKHNTFLIIKQKKYYTGNWIKVWPQQQIQCLGMAHRHLREIYHSFAIVGSPATVRAMALKSGANQYTGPAISAKACFMVAGNITTIFNRGRQARPMSSILI